MAGQVQLSFGEVESYCGQLQTVAGELTSNAQSMINIVSQFNGVWTGAAAEAFQNDYEVLKRSHDSLTEALEQITKMIQDYSAKMQELESAYGTSHVEGGM